MESRVESVNKVAIQVNLATSRLIPIHRPSYMMPLSIDWHSGRCDIVLRSSIRELDAGPACFEEKVVATSGNVAPFVQNDAHARKKSTGFKPHIRRKVASPEIEGGVVEYLDEVIRAVEQESASHLGRAVHHSVTCVSMV